MMNQGPQAELEVVKKLEEGENYTTYEALEPTLVIRCVLHKVYKEEELSDGDIQRATAVLRNYARLRHPRIPAISDAWFTEKSVNALELFPDCHPLDLKENNPLALMDMPLRAEICERMLGLLAAMHRLDVVHSHLTYSSFGMGSRNMIFMLRTGIDQALVRAITKEDEKFTLSSQFYSEDIANFALIFLSLICGEELIPIIPDDEWGMPELLTCERVVKHYYPNQTVQNFFMECLKAKAIEENGYPSALEALKDWETRQIRKQMS